MNFSLDEQKGKIAAFYSRVAPIYDAIGPTLFAQFGLRMVDLLQIPSGADVLDIATGRGANLFAAVERVGEVGQVVGIDIAEGMVNETAAVIKQRGLRNATVLLMDAEQMTFADNAFDYALCNFAIFWFPHPEQALAECFRVLRPQGTFAVTLPGESDERWHWYADLLSEYIQRYSVPLPVQGGGARKPDVVQALMTRLGFTDIRQVPIEVEVVYADEQEWWDARWMHGERHPLENMFPEVLARFKADVMAQITSFKQPDGLRDRWRVICMSGIKPAPV